MTSGVAYVHVLGQVVKRKMISLIIDHVGRCNYCHISVMKKGVIIQVFGLQRKGRFLAARLLIFRLKCLLPRNYNITGKLGLTKDSEFYHQKCNVDFKYIESLS